TTSVVDSPEMVMPGVALNEFGITCGQKFGFQLGMLCKLLSDQVGHDFDALLVPSVNQFDASAGTLCLSGSHVNELFHVFDVAALGGLEGIFHSRECIIAEGDRYGVEVREEGIFLVKAVNLIHDIVSLLRIFFMLLLLPYFCFRPS